MGKDLVESKFDKACEGLATSAEITTAAQTIGIDLGKEFLEDLSDAIPVAKAFLISGKWAYRLGKWVWIGSAPQLQRIASVVGVALPTVMKWQEQIDQDTILENFRVLLSQIGDELDNQRLWWYSKALQASATPDKASMPERSSFFITINQLSPGALRIFEYYFLKQSLDGPTKIFDSNSEHYMLELKQQGLIDNGSSSHYAQNMWAFLLPTNRTVVKRARDHFMEYASNNSADLSISFLAEDIGK